MAGQSLDQDTVMKQFTLFDTDKSGCIDVKEFQNLAFALGETITDEEATQFVSTIDTNQDGKISFAEFYDWWSSNTLDNSRDQSKLDTLKARLHSEGFMRSVSNLMSAATDQAVAPGKDMFKVELKASSGDLDKIIDTTPSFTFKYEACTEANNAVAIVLTIQPGTEAIIQQAFQDVLDMPMNKAVYDTMFQPPDFAAAPNGDTYKLTITLAFSEENPMMAKAKGFLSMLSLQELILKFSCTDAQDVKDLSGSLLLRVIAPISILSLLDKSAPKKAKPFIQILKQLKVLSLDLQLRDIWSMAATMLPIPKLPDTDTSSVESLTSAVFKPVSAAVKAQPEAIQQLYLAIRTNAITLDSVSLQVDKSKAVVELNQIIITSVLPELPATVEA